MNRYIEIEDYDALAGLLVPGAVHYKNLLLSVADEPSEAVSEIMRCINV